MGFLVAASPASLVRPLAMANGPTQPQGCPRVASVCPAWSLVRAKLQMALINPTTPPSAERRLAVADGVAGMACFNDHDVQA